MQVNPNDLRIDTFRPPGSGVWGTSQDTGVRITHIPTHIVVEESSDTSVHRNKIVAMQQLEVQLANHDVVTGAQARFDATYITSTQIAAELGVSRVAIHLARKRGTLPEPIIVNQTQIYIWERRIVMPFVDAWRKVLKGA